MHKSLPLVIIVGLAAAAAGWKKHACCQRCGCACAPRKVCHVVVEKKKVPKTCYGCECEEICVPGPSTLCGKHCECKEDPCNPGCFTKKKVYDWIPGCAYVKTRAKLTKREIEVEQKSYKWVVEELCPKCCQGCRDESPEIERQMAAEGAAVENPDVLQVAAKAGAEQVGPAGASGASTDAAPAKSESNRSFRGIFTATFMR